MTGHITGKLIDALVVLVIAGALLPIVIGLILNANLTGVYKVLWSALAIVVVALVFGMIVASLKTGKHGR